MRRFEDYEDLIVDKSARVVHSEFRKWVRLTKSKIATYTQASYDLVNKYNLKEDNTEGRDSLVNQVWSDYTKLSDYILELDEYDKDYDDLKTEYQTEFEHVVRMIVFSSNSIMKED